MSEPDLKSVVIVARERAALWRLLETVAFVLTLAAVIQLLARAIQVAEAAELNSNTLEVMIMSGASLESAFVAAVALVICVGIRFASPLVRPSAKAYLVSVLATVTALIVAIGSLVFMYRAVVNDADLAMRISGVAYAVASLLVALTVVWLSSVIALPASDGEQADGESSA